MATNPPKEKSKEKGAGRRASFYRQQFPLIRWPLIALALSGVLGVTLVAYSKIMLSTRSDEKTEAETALADSKSKLAQAETDQQIIQAYSRKYAALRGQGFYGEEKRLDWIERINHVQQVRKLFPIIYEIAAQQAFRVDASLSADDLELRGSKMRWQMNLLHEGDLFNFLDDLKAKGLYTVDGCTIKRLESGALISGPLDPRLSAECSLYRVTLVERSANREPAIAATTSK